jgi:predicted metal-dependent hydrolase
VTGRDRAGGEGGTPDRIVVDPRGRAKAYRPIPPDVRETAIARGLAAYERGDFYLAHEELEPAWMGTDDAADRELLGGLIKLAAAFVHAARGNRAGVATNLRGARERLTAASAAGADGGIDLPALLGAIDDRLSRVAMIADAPARPVPDPSHDVAGPPGRARRPPLDLAPPTLVRRTTA